MGTSLELKEQRAGLITESRKWLEKAESDNRPQSEIDNEWATRMTEVDKLEGEIKSLERREKLEHVEADLKVPSSRKSSPSPTNRTGTPVTKAERNKMWKSWLGYGRGLNGLSYDGDTLHRAAEFGLGLNNDSVNLRSLNTATTTAGGYATFQTTYDQIQTEQKYYSPILDKVTTIQTSDGNTLYLPQGSDVANSMSIVAQSGASATNVDPTFSRVSLGSYLYRGVELVTYEMLQDSVFDIESWLTTRLAERSGRCLEQQVVAGTGSAQPTGLTTAVTTLDAGTPAVTLALTNKSFYRFEDLFSLFQSVDLAYRSSNTLVLHDSSVWDLRKIKDSQGRYIWDVNNTLVQNSQPDSIAGFKYLISNSIDASNAFNKNLGFFVNLPRMVVRMVNGLQITRLNELYRGNGMIGIEFLMRFDCNYVGHAASVARVRTPAS
jgi:HK97 family phage major capsid protein